MRYHVLRQINQTGVYTMTCELNLDFIATEKGGLAKLRADSVKAMAKFKGAAIKAHYAAIIAAIDARTA